LSARSHQVVFFERDVPYYRSTRDLWSLVSGKLVLYESFASVLPEAMASVRDADVALVTSYCPDACEAKNLLLSEARGLKVFYDLDTPVTLAALERGSWPTYLDQDGLSVFDLVLSFTGGRALDELEQKLGARHVETLYGHVDPEVHRPVAASPCFAGALSYLGTYAEDRRAAFDELFLAVALARPEQRFVLGGSMYPNFEQLPSNVTHFSHVSPASHAELFGSSDFTLNITRGSMKQFGHCPSGRLFEAAASGASLLSDWFEGLEHFFEPGSEVLVVRNRDEVLRALSLSRSARQKLARNARHRVLAEHTADHRARQLETILEHAEARRRFAPSPSSQAVGG
jgi:spore maturation protein CgeB